MLTAVDQDVIAQMRRFTNAVTDFDRRAFLGATGHVEDAHTMKPDQVWSTLAGVVRADVIELLGIIRRQGEQIDTLMKLADSQREQLDIMATDMQRLGL